MAWATVTPPTTATPVATTTFGTPVANNMGILASSWTTYTPTWTGTSNPAIGNGTLTGRYIQIGKTVHALIVTSLGTTTTVGTGTYSWSLPVNAALGAHVALAGACNFFDSSAGTDFGGWTPILGSATTVTTRSSTGTGIGAATPAVPATSDQISIAFTYEAA